LFIPWSGSVQFWPCAVGAVFVAGLGGQIADVAVERNFPLYCEPVRAAAMLAVSALTGACRASTAF
jgi:hypothetical protein